MSVESGQHTSWIGLVAIIAIVAVSALLFLPRVTHAREAANRAACQGTLKQWGMIFSMYATEWKGMYPRMQGPSPWLVGGITTAELGKDCGAEEGFRLTPNPPSVFPEYANDLEVLRCPSLGRPDLKVIREGCKYAGMPTRGDASFQYLGYALYSDDNEHARLPHIKLTNDELDKVLDAFFSRIASNPEAIAATAISDVLHGDIELVDKTVPEAFQRVRHLQIGVERYFIVDYSGPATETASEIVPVMWDRVGSRKEADAGLWLNHVPAGSNVLYLDGHVAFHAQTDNTFPVTPVFAHALQRFGLID